MTERWIHEQVILDRSLILTSLLEEFAKLINHPDPSSADITIQGISEWDPNSQYKDVVDATRKACEGGDVMVYRVSKGSVKAEYWLVGCHGKGKDGRILGVKALAVES